MAYPVCIAFRTKKFKFTVVNLLPLPVVTDASHLEHFFTSLRLYLVHIQTEETYATKKGQNWRTKFKDQIKFQRLFVYFWDLRSNPWDC